MVPSLPASPSATEATLLAMLLRLLDLVDDFVRNAKVLDLFCANQTLASSFQATE
jgi:hypothetical protein